MMSSSISRKVSAPYVFSSALCYCSSTWMFASLTHTRVALFFYLIFFALFFLFFIFRRRLSSCHFLVKFHIYIIYMWDVRCECVLRYYPDAVFPHSVLLLSFHRLSSISFICFISLLRKSSPSLYDFFCTLFSRQNDLNNMIFVGVVDSILGQNRANDQHLEKDEQRHKLRTKRGDRRKIICYVI